MEHNQSNSTASIHQAASHNGTNPTASTSTDSFKFQGDGVDVFYIWIKNIIFSILTLGIYSAWGSVYMRRYFYENTHLHSTHFDYLAEPMQILKGRLLVIFLIILNAILNVLIPGFILVTMVILFFAIPWIINSAIAFNMRMTAYRQVRFSFKGTYGQTFLHAIIYPLLSIFTLGLALPWVQKVNQEHILQNIYWGDRKVDSQLSTAKFYQATLIIIGGILLVVAVVIGIQAFFFYSSFSMGGGMNLEMSPMSQFQLQALGVTALIVAILMPFLFMLAYITFLITLLNIYMAFIYNHVYSNTKIPNVATPISQIPLFKYSMVMITNFFLILFTLGLGYPWAKVRQYRMVIESMEVTLHSDVDKVKDVDSESISAFAAEYVGQ